MNSVSVVIIGATSGIAQPVARAYASRGATLFLVARNAEALSATASDLLARGASRVETLVADVQDGARHDEIVHAAKGTCGTIDVVLIAHGILRNQQEIDHDVDEMLRLFEVNATSVLSLAQRFGLAMESQRSGTIAVLTSVAGERGRRSLYTYGASKAAVSHFLAGMRGRYKPLGINILDIRPGPVDTPMLAGRPQPLIATADAVARDIVKAIDRGTWLLYTPWYWRYVMAIVRLIPERIMMRLKY